jgi:ABC-type transport system involved in cytochrome c biogenesis permease subunit
MINKSQSKTLADFLVNISTAWFVGSIIAPSFSKSSFSEATGFSIVAGIVSGFIFLFLALYFSKERNE